MSKTTRVTFFSPGRGESSVAKLKKNLSELDELSQKKEEGVIGMDIFHIDKKKAYTKNAPSHLPWGEKVAMIG